MPAMKSSYLGDGAYVEWNGYAYVLYTSDGITRTNEIYLERPHIQELMTFVKSITG